MADGRSALITGIAGQDGSFLAELLLEHGYEVTGLSRHGEQASLGSSEHLRGRISVVAADITDAAAMSALVASVRPDGALPPRGALVHSALLGAPR